MSHSIIKLVPRLKHSILRHSKFRTLLFLQLSSLHIQAAKPVSQNANHGSFTVKYLIDKCGFSRDKAVLASRYVNFARPDKPDACLSFFKNHGFTDAQLLKLLTKYARIISYDPEKTLLPKIQFLHSMGFVEADIPALLVAEPQILVRRVEGHLVPTFDFLKHHLGCVETTVKTIKTCPRILSISTHVLRHNMKLLEEAGVPSTCIASALRTQPLVFCYPCDKMQKLVEDIKKTGIDPRSWKSMPGFHAMKSLTKLGWKNKLEVYRRWDCSEDEVLAAFKRLPDCVKASEEKIDELMGFIVNEMGWSPQMLLLSPQLFRFSLQKRIVPRCSVYKLLLSKGLLKEKGSLYEVVKYSEDKFLDKFINCYPQEAPKLLRLYEEKIQAEKSVSQNANHHPFTVKYLIDKCGFSRYKAVSASKYVNFAKPDKPDACFSFFKNHGFTDAQILKLLKKYPRIITYDPEKTLLPKIQFLHSMGFVEADITALLVAQPNILLRSLEGHFVPTFDLLKDHLGCVKTTVKTIISHPRILSNSQTRVLHRNIQFLKEAGVPTSSIASALRFQPLVLASSCRKMQKVVRDIEKIGIDPRTRQFIREVGSMQLLSKLAWKKKLEVLWRWDCSSQEVLTAFKKEPRCMKVSEEKIDGVMDFFVNKLELKPQMLLLTPQLFRYSLQKRIVPRCSVHKLLLSKGLLKVKGSLYQVVKYSEDKFLEKFINCYPEEAPSLLRLYEEKMKAVPASIDKCGFSRDKAVSASKYVNFDKPDKADVCLSFLKSHGFSDAQLSKLLKKCPTLLVSDIQKTLPPKIQFLHSMGFVKTDITALLVAEPTILLRSLEGCLVPIFDLLIDHLGSVQNTVNNTVKYYTRILSLSPCVLDRNIQLLKKAGVPSSCIASALRTQPSVFAYSCDKMKEVVKDIKKMQINPKSWQFMTGVFCMGSLGKLAWKNKFAVYQRWDCSEKEVLQALKRDPRCMTVSEEKIDGVMNFFVNEMGWSSQMLLLTPALFSYSLHKRIIPRCSVYKLLLSKGLLKVKGCLYAVKYTEHKFHENFINCYPEEAPELLRLYEEKKNNSMTGYNSEDDFLEKFINCYPEEAPELFRLYEEKMKKTMNKYKT